MSLLEVKDLTVRYSAGDSSPALAGVSFTVERGERIALTGNNGAGKSTLFLALTGILTPEKGDIIFNGTADNAKNRAENLRRRTGLVMQNPDDQLFMPTVDDDIAFGLRNRGITEPEIKAKTDKVMAALGITALKGRLTHRLSGGEKRLTALAGILVMEPELMLLDEPATFLDPPGRQRLIEALSGLSQAMLIATHDSDFAERLCTRSLRLEQGRITAAGT